MPGKEVMEIYRKKKHSYYQHCLFFTSGNENESRQPSGWTSLQIARVTSHWHYSSHWFRRPLVPEAPMTSPMSSLQRMLLPRWLMRGVLLSSMFLAFALRGVHAWESVPTALIPPHTGWTPSLILLHPKAVAAAAAARAAAAAGIMAVFDLRHQRQEDGDRASEIDRKAASISPRTCESSS